MNDTDDAALGDRVTDDDPDAPECTCPDEEDWGSPVEPPPDPACPIHGEEPASASELAEAEVEGAQGGGPWHPYDVQPPVDSQRWAAHRWGQRHRDEDFPPGVTESGHWRRNVPPSESMGGRDPRDLGVEGELDDSWPLAVQADDDQAQHEAQMQAEEDPEQAIQEERSREPGGPPPMPTPPEHDTGCDPSALEIHPDLGWVCMECAMVLGGDQEHATITPATPEPESSRTEPGAALAQADPIGAAIHVLDPTMIQGPQEFAEQLLYMVARLSQAEYAQRGATHEAVEAKIAYERAYDLAIAERKGQGSADVRAAEARIQCAELLNDWDRRKAVLEAIKGAAHSWRAMISGYQSAARLVNDAYGVQGRYGS